LIELLVVIAIISILAAMLLPALAGGRAIALRTQCLSGQKQIGLAFNFFKDDNNNMYPPAGYEGGGQQLTWDSWIHRYIGGTASAEDLLIGLLPIESSPKVLKCPADREPKVPWIGDFHGVRSYAMVSVGSSWQAEYQVPTDGLNYSLPTARMGVGIYWAGAGTPDWNAMGYQANVVRDNSGTILLVEQPNGQGAAANVWPCISIGPYGNGALFQIHPGALPQGQDPDSPGVNQGEKLYKYHRNRFNYLFFDGHVQTLRAEDTVGTGSRITPRGMWTIKPSD
jgi:prepilin-type processing-associated H-X9-DG protein